MNIVTHTKPEVKPKAKRVEYSSLLILSGGGQYFFDTTVAGLLRQTQGFLDSYHHPGSWGDYSCEDHELNVRTLWQIMSDEPKHIDEVGNRHYYAGDYLDSPTIH
jgi:hypothetical protein